MTIEMSRMISHLVVPDKKDGLTSKREQLLESSRREGRDKGWRPLVTIKRMKILLLKI